MINWEYDSTEPKKTGPKKKVVKKKNDAKATMDTVEGDDNIIYFYSGVSAKENFKLNF